MTRRVIMVGECSLDMEMTGLHPSACRPAGPLVDTAIALASAGLQVSFTGEAAADPAGTALVEMMANAGVDTSGIDRYADGPTPMRVTYRPSGLTMIYDCRIGERLSFGWPQASPGDIVVSGGAFALQQRSRQAVTEFVEICLERGMMVVWLPEHDPRRVPPATHMMPMLLDDLDRAHLTVATPEGLGRIFGNNDAATCFRRHTAFCNPLLVSPQGHDGLLTCTPSGCTLTSPGVPPEADPLTHTLIRVLGALALDQRSDLTTITTTPPKWNQTL